MTFKLSAQILLLITIISMATALHQRTTEALADQVK